MRETGILSIVKRGLTSQVRYASFNPYDQDRLSYPCPEEGAMVTLLHHFGIDDWLLQQTVTALRKGDVAVLTVALSEAQLQAYFPPQRPPHVGVDVEDKDVGGQVGSLRGPAPAQNMTLTQHLCHQGQ